MLGRFYCTRHNGHPSFVLLQSHKRHRSPLASLQSEKNRLGRIIQGPRNFMCDSRRVDWYSGAVCQIVHPAFFSLLQAPPLAEHSFSPSGEGYYCLAQRSAFLAFHRGEQRQYFFRVDRCDLLFLSLVSSSYFLLYWWICRGRPSLHFRYGCERW